MPPLSPARPAVLALAAALAACAPVTHPPEPESVVLPETFALLDREAATSGEPALLLPVDDPAFAPLHDAAIAGSPDLAAAIARIDIARAQARGAAAERLPDINFSATAERQRISSAQFGGGGNGNTTGFRVDPNRTQYNPAISASWDADIFGRLRASERAARARLDAAGADAAAVRLALIADTARALTDYRTIAARQAVIEADLASAESLVTLTRVRSQAGIAPGFDLVRAQALADQARARLEPIAAERAATLAELTTLTALPIDQVQAMLAVGGPDATARALPAAQALPALTVPSVLLRRRPDIIAAERRLAAADADIAAAAAARFPRLSITGAIGLIALSLGDLFDNDALVGTLGGEIAGPLIDFGRIGAEIDRNEAAGREAFANYRGAVFQGLGEVEAALGAIAARDAQVRALAAQVAGDRDAVALARERYRRGLDTFLTVLDAERTANASGEALATARGEAQRQRIALYRAIGGGVEAMAVTPADPG